VESSPDYLALKQGYEQASRAAAPRIKEINEKLRDVGARILAVQNTFTDRRARVGASTYAIETETSASSKQSKQRDLAEYEQQVTTVSYPDGSSKTYDYPHLEETYNDLRNERTTLSAELGELIKPVNEQKAKLDAYVSDHMVSLTPAQITGLVDKTEASSPKIQQINVPEANIVDRDVNLAQQIRESRLHVAHLSTSDALKAVRRGKRAKARVTCEVTPHHFTLLDEDVGEYNTNFKMNPPLRSASDREAILVALADGTVDAIATDHAPHATHEKQVEFERAAFGITGLETALALAITKLHRDHKISLTRIVELFTSGPARVFDLRSRGSLARGNFADVTIFDPKKRWTFESAKSRSLSRNTPFDGWQFTGKVVATIVGGRIVNSAD